MVTVADLRVAAAARLASALALLALASALVADDVPPVIIVPPSVVLPAGGVVHPSFLLTSAVYVDMALGVGWRKPMGDWIDADSVFNGPKPTISVSGKTVTVDVSRIAGDIIIQGAFRTTSVTLDGVYAGAFYTDTSGNHSLPIPPPAGYSQTTQPIIIPNSGGKSLTIVSSTGGTFRIDAVANPVPTILTPAGSYTAPNLLRINPTSFDAVVIPGSVAAQSSPTNKCFNGPYSFETDRGVPIVRAHCEARRFPVIGGGRIARCDYPLGQQPTLNVAMLLRAGDTVARATQDLGMKMSGMGGNEGRWNIGELINAYFPVPGVIKNPRNYPLMGLRDYFYSAEATAGQGAGNGQSSPYSFGFIPSGSYIHLEWRSARNTFNADGTPNSDGRKQTLINGNMVEDRSIKWFANVASFWTTMSLQLYLGGVQSWGEDCYFDIGPFMASTQPIGVDPMFLPLLMAA